MSTSKRPRTSRTAGPQRSSSPGEPPASKRRKPSHVPEQTNGLAFLVDENERAGKTVKAKLTNGVPRSNGVHLDESHAILTQNGVSDETAEESLSKSKVAAPKEIIDISSGEDESSVLEDSDEEQTEAQTDANVQLLSGIDNAPLTNGHLSEDVEEQAAGGAEDVEMEDNEESAEKVAEPASFGELLQARHPGPIDVRRTLQETGVDSRALVTAPDEAMITTGHSLRTALSQALKNNDRDLLESCLATNSVQTIRVTIQRLKSLEVATLLERIAERIFRSPGRTGPLMVWVQWSLVDHGGYLANQPELMQKLRTLAQVVRERASGLLPLLHLKGKLDLLSAQLQHRRDLQINSKAINLENLDDDRGVLYIDGQDDDWSDSDDALDGEKQAGGAQIKGKKLLGELAEDADSDDDVEQDLPNGISHGLEEESSAAGEDDEEEAEEYDLLDIEAEEDSEDESAEQASSDEEAPSDDDEDEEGSEIVVATPKLSTLNRKR